MIRIQVDLDGKGKPLVRLYLDGEFQTVFGGDGSKEYYTVEDCIQRARDIRKVVPTNHLEITSEALQKLEILSFPPIKVV